MLLISYAYEDFLKYTSFSGALTTVYYTFRSLSEVDAFYLNRNVSAVYFVALTCEERVYNLHLEITLYKSTDYAVGLVYAAFKAQLRNCHFSFDTFNSSRVFYVAYRAEEMLLYNTTILCDGAAQLVADGLNLQLTESKITLGSWTARDFDFGRHRAELLAGAPGSLS